MVRRIESSVAGGVKTMHIAQTAWSEKGCLCLRKETVASTPSLNLAGDVFDSISWILPDFFRLKKSSRDLTCGVPFVISAVWGLGLG